MTQASLAYLGRFAFVLICLVAFVLEARSATPAELARWQAQARNVTITRDDWGIAHVVGKSDADTVFGAIYAQAEDDFNRIETNYLNSLGRLAEAEGESAIWSDLRMKIFIDPDVLKSEYTKSPAWLKKLMDAWADGLNFYLATHPNTKPRAITKFEPWMALSFTEGSIGGDIESIDLDRLREMYSSASSAGSESRPVGIATGSFNDQDKDLFKEPSGSNGIAIAPKNTKNSNALLLINPHTSFFFRSELQMTSGEGLNAYGASTWGQFFIYQGFNENCGWMHTSSEVDAIDEFRETIAKRNGKYFYKFGDDLRQVQEVEIQVPYKTAGGIETREFIIYRTHHGPVVRKMADAGHWITVALMNTPVKALMQSYGRTKAKNLKEFQQVMDLHANSSNATLYADRDGNIAYFHANYIPVRNDKFNWIRPVDGTDPETEYKGLLSFSDSPNLINPSTGWVYNSNNWPWSAGGAASLKQKDYPRWVDSGVETSRGLHAIRVLENKKDFTLDGLRTAAYDSYLTWFDTRLASLVAAWDALPANDELKTKTAEQIAVLRAWDQRWSTESVATSLAIFWGHEVIKKNNAEAIVPATAAWKTIKGRDLVTSLLQASDKLTADFGTWKTPWGEINRFQRLTADIVHPFNDAGPSIPVGFTSGNWGSLASFGAGPRNGSKKWYGTSGNSFVAVVEFGKQVRAKAVTAGGESGDVRSKHFNDQATRYSTGDLREVYFYPSQLKGHTERVYRPGKTAR